MVLAVINIVFFSVMIFENQSDLLVNSFKYQSSNLVNDVLSNLEGIKISKAEDEDLRRLRTNLAKYELKYSIIYDKSGLIWHSQKRLEEPPTQVPRLLLQKAGELSAEGAMFRARYSMELNEADYSIDLILPLNTQDDGQVFLYAPLNIRSMQKRLNEMYVQIGIAILWGVVFHVAFAIFLFRIIFRRVSILKNASDDMSAGNLSARANWKESKKHDELDELGQAFNSMAASIEEKVDTISRLNGEIQQELQIGKEVQELFLSDPAVFADLNLTLYYRPLCEVSGDVYKFYQFPNGLRGLFFADASGHGVSAALITTITILSLDDIVKNEVKPGPVMTRLNDMLAERLDTSFFATGIFLLVDKADNYYICNCGHNPMVALRPSTGESLEVDKMGPPLGLMESFEYQTRRLNVKRGDKLLIYSDGLVETPDASGTQYTLERAVKIFQENAAMSNQELHELLQADFTSRSNDYRDDVTFMFVEIP